MDRPIALGGARITDEERLENRHYEWNQIPRHYFFSEPRLTAPRMCAVAILNLLCSFEVDHGFKICGRVRERTQNVNVKKRPVQTMPLSHRLQSHVNHVIALSSRGNSRATIPGAINLEIRPGVSRCRVGSVDFVRHEYSRTVSRMMAGFRKSPRFA
jgi:hypothetical protein